ncbi:MAG TPA: winged helix-turn-helix domain-containing protein, partial [Pyrinomonadaceae bacterium]
MERIASDTPPRPSTHVWKFGDCEVDERRRDLRVRGMPIELEAKPWEVLRQLLLHAGEVVTKEELLDCVWPGLTVVDSSLATAIFKLRKALGAESMVVTVPRVGYRLAVPVQTSATPDFESAKLNLFAGHSVPSRDQWRLLSRLDKSPSSEVWLAEHPKTHALRVFKFAPAGLALRALKREVTLARLLHDSFGERPDFVRVLEWNFDKAPYFIESEYVGPNLAEWASSEGGLQTIATDLRLSLFIDAVRAVAAAHSVDVLHKDLKPSNILVSKTSTGTHQIKIADFGSASLLSPSRLGALGITNLGFTHPVGSDEDSITGTVMYIAPEVLAGQSPSAASDVYALGVLLYQLMAGDFRKPLAPGWEADIADPLLREDIAEAACGDPTRRIQTALELEKRLTSLERRRAKRDELEQVRQRALFAERRRAEIRSRLPWLLIAAVIPLALLAVFFAFRRRPVPAIPTLPRLKPVAVLPFQNVGSDSSIDYLRLALPDEITTTLSHTRGLLVRPFASTTRYDQPVLDAQKVGREMGVSSIVFGHFSKIADQLHITLEAIDVESNSVLWRGEIDAPAQNMIGTRVQIMLKVRGGLAQAIGATAADTAAQPKNEEAYALFLRAVALTFDLKTNREAIAMLEKSVELDPEYAPSWHTLARAYSTDSHYTSDGRGSSDRSDMANERALALDPDYIPARAARVESYVEHGELIRAYDDAQDLVGRYPDNPDAHFSLSYVLRFAGLLDESAKHCDTAFQLERQSPTLTLRSCAMVFLLKGDYPQALNYLNHYAGSDFATSLSIDILLRQGKEKEALQLGLAHTPQWAGYNMLMAYAQHKPATEVDALAVAMQVSDDPETNYLMSGHLSYCGQTTAALEMLRKAIKGRYCSYPAIESDPFFATLRTKPEFAEIRAAAI